MCQPIYDQRNSTGTINNYNAPVQINYQREQPRVYCEICGGEVARGDSNSAFLFGGGGVHVWCWRDRQAQIDSREIEQISTATAYPLIEAKREEHTSQITYAVPGAQEIMSPAPDNSRLFAADVEAEARRRHAPPFYLSLYERREIADELDSKRGAFVAALRKPNGVCVPSRSTLTGRGET